MQLKVSPALSLPLETVTARMALLAVSGAGKSNAMRVLAEAFFEASLPFVAIDPKGDWWGLRAGRDGKPKGGLDVAIFGGRHGDVPLEKSGGKLVADIIVDQRLSCILDLSLFEFESDRKAFLYDFGRRLYFRNQDPLHLFFEECDDYLPQKPMKDELKLLRVYENIVRRGRTKGLGITLISQRSAVVNKNVLTQAETLFALRTSAPQDIAAIESWMKYHGGDTAMLKTLAGLESGEAWVWSPHFLKETGRRFRFQLSRTFDSGATPTNRTKDAKRKPATLADIDVAALSKAMSETIERQAADDPRLLRQRIAELERQSKAKQSVAKPVVERVEVPVFSKEDRAAVERISQAVERVSATTAALALKVSELAGRIKVPAPLPAKRPQVELGALGTPVPKRDPASKKATARERVEPASGIHELGKCERALMGVLLQHGPMPLDDVALIAHYAPGSGSVLNAASTLRKLDWVVGTNARLELSHRVGRPESSADAYPIGSELADYWLKKITKAERGILEAVMRRYPDSIPLDEAATEANYATGSGSVLNAASRLRKRLLVEGGNSAMRVNSLLMD